MASLPHGVSFLGFLPGAIGYIAMLMVDERDRLAHWGRLVARDLSPDPDTTIDTSGLSATGRRISSLALATAVVIPIFIPVFSNTLLDGPGTGTGGGGDSLSFSDPMVSLANSLQRKDPVDVLRVTGDLRPSYLRLAVLDEPGPDSWGVRPITLSTTIPASSVLPLPEGLDSDIDTTPHSMHIDPTSEFPADSAWLPVPFDLRTVNVSGDWSYVPQSQVVTANTELAAVGMQSYDLAYSSVNPTTEQLRAAGPPPADIVDTYAHVPSGVPAIIAQEARAITTGASTPYDQALALQTFFRDPSQFDYDLDAGYGYGYEAMVKFLDQRRGFCQHFSATMAMMAREVGIPSRVVVGFLQPERADGDSWVLTSHNVHSWPELYFDGIGWVRFEPTPGVGAPLPSYAPRPDGTSTGPTSVGTAQEQTSTTRGAQETIDKTTEAAANGGKGRWRRVRAPVALVAGRDPGRDRTRDPRDHPAGDPTASDDPSGRGGRGGRGGLARAARPHHRPPPALDGVDDPAGSRARDRADARGRRGRQGCPEEADGDGRAGPLRDVGGARIAAGGGRPRGDDGDHQGQRARPAGARGGVAGVAAARPAGRVGAAAGTDAPAPVDRRMMDGP